MEVLLKRGLISAQKILYGHGRATPNGLDVEVKAHLRGIKSDTFENASKIQNYMDFMLITIPTFLENPFKKPK
jgi:hypothetical protein